MNRPICTFILGNGFSQGFGFPSFKELWKDCLKISLKKNNFIDKQNFEEGLKQYPLSYFIENNICDIELLLSLWSSHIEYKREIETYSNANTTGQRHYEDYIKNLCCHLLEYGDKASLHDNFRSFITWLNNKIQNYEFRFITLNYDLVLEKIITNISKKFIYMEKSADNKNILIRKLHGSVDWFKSSGSNLTWVSTGKKIPIFKKNNNEYYYYANINNSEVPYIAFGNPVLIPPIAFKEYSIFFKEILNLTKRDLECSDYIIIVGYSFPQSDEIITQFIKNNLNSNFKKLVYINSAEKHCERVKNLFRNKIVIINKIWSINLFDKILN